MNSFRHNITLAVICFILTAPFAIGCMSWEDGWKQFGKSSIKGDVVSLLAKAEEQANHANSKEKLLKLIDAYENILKVDPKNYEALYSLGSYCFLAGYGYSDNSDEKRVFCRKAIKYCEQAIYTNPDFKSLVDTGEKLWEACRVLSKKEMEPMWWWYLAVGVHWKECLSGPGKLVNIYWLARAKKVLTRMIEIDPAWQNGTPYYSWANYYAVAPGVIGGDMEKAEESYKKAIELGPNMLNFRRTRAKLLHTKNNDREAFKKDLSWVISQDPHRAGGLTYPWNAFIQRDAQEGLENIDDYFK